MPASGSHKVRSSAWRVFLLLRQKRTTTVVLLFLILITSSLDIAVPFITQHLIDNIVQSVRNPGRFAMNALFLSLAAIFVSVAATRVLRSVYNYSLFQTMAGIEDKLKSAAFENYLRCDTALHTSTSSGEIIGALDRGATAIFVVLYEILGQNLVPPLIIFAGVFTSLLFKSPLIAFTVFLPLPLYVLIVGRFSESLQKQEQIVSREFELVSKECYDIAGNVATVKKFSQERREAALQRRLLANARVPQFLAERNWAAIETIQTLIATLGRVAVIGLGGYSVLHGRCTVGEYVLYIALQDMLFGPMAALAILLPKLRRNMARAERLFEVFDLKPSLVDAHNAAKLAPFGSEIEFRDVSFRYPQVENWTLSSVSFRVPAGSTVALIGRSGTGKSTLINLLMRCYDPQNGTILLDGVDISEASQESLRRQIAIVPQEVDLFCRTIAENIAYGCPDATREDVERVARLALAHDFIERADHGYETLAGERGLRLSGGERQRIGIARAILRNPRILVLDEATSHLDTESEHLIQRALESVSKDRTCFIIAHRLSTVRHANLVVVLANGGIEAVGTHAELRQHSPTYRRLHELHSHGNDIITDESYDTDFLELAS